MPHTTNVKFQDHFKLIIQFGDKINFEAALERQNIDYYVNEDGEADSGLYFTYFLLDEDRPIIDQLLKQSGIIAGTETIPTSYGSAHNKFNLVVFIVLAILIGLTLISVFVGKLMK